MISQGLLPAQAWYTADPKFIAADQQPVRSISIGFLQEDALLKTAKNLFHSLHFLGTARVLENFADACSRPERREKAKQFERYCNALGYWDDYRLGMAKNEMQQIAKQLPLLEEQYDTLCKLVEDIKRSKTEETLLILLDLYHNASRSLRRGQYADTLARTVRTYEGLLKWRLQNKYCLKADFNEMDPEKRKKIEEFFKEKSRHIDKKGYLTCDNIKVLLVEYYADNEVKEWDQQMRSSNYARNHSIVAHGTKEVKEDVARKALQVLREILQNNGANIDSYSLSNDNILKHEEKLFAGIV